MLRLKSFDYISPQFESARFGNRRHVGVFAQDIMAVVPDAVTVMPAMHVHMPERPSSWRSATST